MTQSRALAIRGAYAALVVFLAVLAGCRAAAPNPAQPPLVLVEVSVVASPPVQAYHPAPFALSLPTPTNTAGAPPVEPSIVRVTPAPTDGGALLTPTAAASSAILLMREGALVLMST